MSVGERSSGDGGGPGQETFAAAVRRVLDFARAHLGMDVAWVSRFSTGRQVFEYVSAAEGGGGPVEGSGAALDGAYCVRALDGRLPGYITDARANPTTRDLAVTHELGIGSYLGVPVTRRDGGLHGMLCCTAREARPGLSARDTATLELIAGLLGELLDQAGAGAYYLSLQAARRRVAAALADPARRVVLQPIVDLGTGSAVAVEALTRFGDATQSPQAWYAEAAAAGLRVEAELTSARSALAILDGLDPSLSLSVNLSPDALIAPAGAAMLAAVDRTRLILEITEHAPVEDYEALTLALSPHRAAGARIAIDDAGAGYASFRHILRLNPDLIKIDEALVRDIDVDPVRQALTGSLLILARTAGAQLIAEGVETRPERDTLADLRTTLAQG